MIQGEMMQPGLHVSESLTTAQSTCRGLETLGTREQLHGRLLHEQIEPRPTRVVMKDLQMEPEGNTDLGGRRGQPAQVRATGPGRGGAWGEPAGKEVRTPRPTSGFWLSWRHHSVAGGAQGEEEQQQWWQSPRSQ